MGERLDVLSVTKGHKYDRTAFGAMLDALPGMECTQVEHPAAQVHFSPAEAAKWDAFLMYDMPGYVFKADHTHPDLVDPPDSFRSDFSQLVEAGHGFVFVHHALAAWPTWPEYGRVMGGRFHFVRTDDQADSGYRHAVTQNVSPVGTHPVLAGLENGFSITDELYLNEVYDDAITPLLTTDAELTDETLWSTWNAVLGRRDTNDGWEHPKGSRVVAWVRDHPRSRIIYIQLGDSADAFSNPAYRRLLANALAWVSRREEQQ